MFTTNRIKANILLVSTILLCLCLVSCNPKFTEPDPGTSFQKIYHKDNLLTYTAIDIQQTGDGGYIILGTVGEAPYLLRVDNGGNYMWDTAPGDFSGCRAPIASLLIINSLDSGYQNYYFACVKKFADKWGAALLKFSEKDMAVTREFPITFNNYSPKEIIKPLHAVNIGSGTIILSLFDDFWAKILVAEIDVPGAGAESAIGTVQNESDVSFNCFLAYPPMDERFYIIGKTSNQLNYYFQTYNSSNNDSSSECFLLSGDAVDEFPISIPFIALQWHGNGKLSGAHIENNRLYYIIDQSINDLNKDDLDKEPVVDMDETKPIFVKEMSINGEKIIYFGTTSRSHRLGINAYDAEGTFKGSRFYGNTHDYETAGLLQTSDNGLAIVGNTKVEARMSRICLFKLSEAEVESMAGQ